MLDRVVATTRGLSMFPSVLPGDELELRAREHLSTGDIIGVIGDTGDLVAHRLLGYCLVTGCYLTSGDACAERDAAVP